MRTYWTSYFGPTGLLAKTYWDATDDDTAIARVSEYMDRAGDCTLAVIDERITALGFRPVATIRDQQVEPTLTVNG